MNRSTTSFARAASVFVLIAALAAPIAGASAVSAAPGPASPSRAEGLKIKYKKRILTITGNAGGNQIELECIDKKVWLNSSENLGMPCKRVKEISLFGKGGEDDLDVDRFSPAEFPSLKLVTIDGGPGSDDIYGWAKRDIIRGGKGVDYISPEPGKNTVDGGKGKDIIYQGGRNLKLTPTLLTTTTSKDTIKSIEEANVWGTYEDDVIDLRKWNRASRIYGYGGHDTIYGSPQSDYVDGGSQDDIIKLGKGDDEVLQSPGNDTVAGGPGRDILRASVGGTGQSATVSDTQIVNTSLSGTSLLSSIEDMLIFGNTGSGIVVDASATSRDMRIMGSAGPDTLTGGSGNDTITGYAGNDILNGNAGDDFLDGEGDTDTANGGLDFDTCVAESKMNCEA